MSKNPRIAVIHDELVRKGGAETVLEEILRLYPQADVYALYASDNAVITVDGVEHKIHTSFLQKFPKWFRKHPSRLLPFLSQAAEQFDFSKYDLVISSSSGFAKGIVTRPSVPHICYCHTPTRYLWDATHEVMDSLSGFRKIILAIMLHYARMGDYAGAQRADIMIANSFFTKRRIQTYYRRESDIIYPPIKTDFFTPLPQKSDSTKPFLIVSRLTPSKHIEDAINVCEKLRFPLRIVGVGRGYARLKKISGEHTAFLGKVSPEVLRQEYRSARALLQPGIEDFGMASAEALSCGLPVIALGKGGVLEVVSSPAFGQLYPERGPEGLAEAIRQFMEREHTFTPSLLQQHAFKFSASRFRAAFQAQVEAALQKNAKNSY